MKDIFEGINKNVEDEDKLNFSIFKDIMENLQTLNIIYDGGKDGKDSFFVNEKTAFENVNHQKTIQSPHFTDVHEDITDNNLYQYIDEKWLLRDVRRIQ